MSPATTALERLVRRGGPGQAAGSRCGFCSEPVPDAHRHVLDGEHETLQCACRACALLFVDAPAGGERFRLVPQRRLRLETQASPQSLGAPVGLAFFVRRRDGSVVAHYPSPMGATRWEVDAGMWAGLQEAMPALRDMEPETEALLLNTARGANERWLVPIDDCYRLVAVVRRHWRGLSGGSEVWGEIDRFFDALQPAPAAASTR
jgi:hypothetical protein